MTVAMIVDATTATTIGTETAGETVSGTTSASLANGRGSRRKKAAAACQVDATKLGRPRMR